MWRPNRVVNCFGFEKFTSETTPPSTIIRLQICRQQNSEDFKSLASRNLKTSDLSTENCKDFKSVDGRILKTSDLSPEELRTLHVCRLEKADNVQSVYAKILKTSEWIIFSFISVGHRGLLGIPKSEILWLNSLLSKREKPIKLRFVWVIKLRFVKVINVRNP